MQRSIERVEYEPEFALDGGGKLVLCWNVNGTLPLERVCIACSQLSSASGKRMDADKRQMSVAACTALQRVWNRGRHVACFARGEKVD
jgi:hypothetical protein